MAVKTIGSFQIQKELGAGSAGIAYLASDTQSDRRVALKILSPQTLGDETVQRRFIREMSVMSKLHHPNIVELYECGLHEDNYYYAMEWIDYGTLKHILMSRDTIPWREACECGIQISEALGFAHDHGIVHRDLKPANVFLSTDGRVKLGDFGLAKDRTSYSLTAEGLTVGTCQYMAPEQIEGQRDLTGSADLYALGCMLYELLSGKQPYQGHNVIELLGKHLHAPPPDVRQVVPATPAALAQLIQRLMAKKPADRPQSGQEVAAELRSILEDRPAAKKADGAAPSNLFDRMSGADARQPITWQKLAVIGAILAALIGVVVVLSNR